jgi:hypothetical protein
MYSQQGVVLQLGDWVRGKHLTIKKRKSFIWNVIQGLRLGWASGWGQGPVAGSCECGNEHSHSIMVGNFLTSCVTISFLRRPLLHMFGHSVGRLVSCWIFKTYWWEMHVVTYRFSEFWSYMYCRIARFWISKCGTHHFLVEEPELCG